jgi:hypothetical protein
MRSKPLAMVYGTDDEKLAREGIRIVNIGV